MASMGSLLFKLWLENYRWESTPIYLLSIALAYRIKRLKVSERLALALEAKPDFSANIP